MTSSTRPKFRHVAINGKEADTGDKYAADLEREMNKLAEEGYSIQLNEMKHFTVLMGLLTSEADARESEHPVMRLLRLRMGGALPGSAPGTGEYSPRTKELLNRFDALSAQVHGDVEVFITALRKQFTELTRGFSTEELAVAAKEFAYARAEHDKEHDSPYCDHTRVLGALIELLRAAVQSQLQ